ncbi:peptidoglycan-binding protein [Streptomyces sp. NPDC029006]|uniref:peptidoglycan-binding protein n=1 Tax=Streptomyces sp. NPDC029006 TaxID=3155467 RepID=UPI0033EDA630
MSTTPQNDRTATFAESAESEERPSRGRRRTKRLRRIAVMGVTAAVLSATVVVARQHSWLSGQDGEGDSHAKPQATAVVERTSLSTGMELKGNIGFGHERDVVGSTGGVLTAIRKEGDTVRPGQWLWERDGVPVPFFEGDRPLWRVLKKQPSGKHMHGKDVRDLKRNLIDLGWADGLGLSADDEFTAATETAVKRWQKHLGAPQTGQVGPGSVVMIDLPTLRVTKVIGAVGVQLSGTVLLKATGTDLMATAKVTYDQLSLLSPGTRLKIGLPTGGTVNGKVTLVEVHSQRQDDAPDSGGGGGGDTKQQSEVTVSLPDQKTVAKGGPGPVTLTVVDHRASQVLAVPVTALLALAEGGYGVEVVQPDGRQKLVPVTIGLVADALVQITKGDLKEGTKVVIPE